MTPTDFEFTVILPGDARLVAAVRQLAMQAAGYAQLPTAVAERLAGHVEQATHAAIAATRVQTAQIDFRFTGDSRAVAVEITCEAAPSVRPPQSTSSHGLTVDWNAAGERHTCHIRQLIPA
jgi:hypothetical protein